MSIAPSVAQRGSPWTSNDDAQLTVWVQETRAQLSPNARGIPKDKWAEIAAKIGATVPACKARVITHLKLLRPVPIIWTDDQEKKLKAWVKATRAELEQGEKRKGIPNGKWDEIGKQIDKSGPACKEKAKLLKLLDKNLRKHWSKKEEATLEQWVKEVQESSESDTFSQEQWEKIAAQLPGRTAVACQNHAADLGFLMPLNRRAWTEEEYDQLEEFVENNKNDEGFVPQAKWEEIAVILDRTPGACHIQAGQRNLLTPLNMKPWTEEEQHQLEEFVENNKNDEGFVPQAKWEEIATTLDRKPKSCQTKASLLGILECKEWAQGETNTLQEWLQTNSDAGPKAWEEAAEKVGRSVKACQHKARQLRQNLQAQQAAFAALDAAPAVLAPRAADIDLHLKPLVVSKILASHPTQEQENRDHSV